MEFVDGNNVDEFNLNFDNVIKRIIQMNAVEFAAVYAKMNECRQFTDEEIDEQYAKFKCDFMLFYCNLNGAQRRAFLKDVLECVGYKKIEE